MNTLTRFARDEERWAQWMSSSLQGDASDYSRLLEELGRVIENYLRARFGQIDALEDCVQECLVAIHQARHTYDINRQFRPWMFTVVRHKTIDILRKHQTWQAAQTSLAEQETPTTDDGPLFARIDGVKILERLHPDHREVVILTKYNGYTAAEAATLLGISESAAKVRLHRALKHIMKFLDKEDPDLCPGNATS